MRLYNTLGRRIDEISIPKQAKIYVCGPTVYDYSHVGHGRIYVTFDVLRRLWEHEGSRVKFVMNITDIDDKMIRRAHERGISVSELATAMAWAFVEDLKTLNVKLPSVIPFATGHVPDIIDIIKRLEKKDFAYASSDGVYFRVRRFGDYGKLSGARIEELKAGARIEPGDKEDPLDFSLWKFQKPGEPSWDSPWGAGRPGWHIECSAMIHRHLGEPIDIHGGGADLIFPHHENEIAQSEAAFDRPLAKTWMHVGLLRIRGEKMSKSLGNIIPLREAFKRWGAMPLRLFYLLHYYREPVEIEDITEAQTLWRRLVRRLSFSGDFSQEDYEAVEAALLNNLDTRAAVQEFIRRAARGRSHWADKTLDLLGLTLPRRRMEPVKKLLEVRRALRARRLFDLSDKIREALEMTGMEILDNGDETEVIVYDSNNS